MSKVQEEIPKYPFHIVAMNLFEYAGRDYLVLFDAYLNYLMAMKLQNKTATHMIGVITQVCDKLGYPTVLKSDNVPFNSVEFNRFSDEYNIELRFSSPRYSQSNGLAEKGVAIAKNILKRCIEANDVVNFQYRISEYNTTPLTGMHAAPSELFFGRIIKTKLPVSDSLLIRNNVQETDVQKNIIKKRKAKILL